MKNGKYSKRRGVATKSLIVALAVMLIVGCTIGGTLAWLQASTQKVENTFTVGNIDITLEETGTTLVNGVDTKSYKMVPGATLGKDPKVTVETGSEDCWLFVTIEKSDNLDNFISYTVAEDWSEFDPVNNPGVYVYVGTVAQGTAISILEDDEVTVQSTVNKDMMDAITNGDADAPTLTFKAYAIQSDNLTDADGDAVDNAAAAWAVLSAE